MKRFDLKKSEQLNRALAVAIMWMEGCASVGDARKAAWGAIVESREATSPVSTAIARSVGHAVATAHMADHALGAAIYALKATWHAGRSVAAERQWQNRRLPIGIKRHVMKARIEKEKALLGGARKSERR